MTNELFEKYESIRSSGKYNMFMDYELVMKEMKLNPRHKSDRDLYMDIINNYDKYKQLYITETKKG